MILDINAVDLEARFVDCVLVDSMAQHATPEVTTCRDQGWRVAAAAPSPIMTGTKKRCIL